MCVGSLIGNQQGLRWLAAEQDEINSFQVYPLVNSHSYGKSQFAIGKSTISMGHFQKLWENLPEVSPWAMPKQFQNGGWISINKLDQLMKIGTAVSTQIYPTYKYHGIYCFFVDFFQFEAIISSNHPTIPVGHILFWSFDFLVHYQTNCVVSTWHWLCQHICCRNPARWWQKSLPLLIASKVPDLCFLNHTLFGRISFSAGETNLFAGVVCTAIMIPWMEEILHLLVYGLSNYLRVSTIQGGARFHPSTVSVCLSSTSEHNFPWEILTFLKLSSLYK